jgi:hypothetical protein
MSVEATRVESVAQAKTRTSARRKAVSLTIAAVLCATCVMYSVTKTVIHADGSKSAVILRKNT